MVYVMCSHVSRKEGLGHTTFGNSSLTILKLLASDSDNEVDKDYFWQKCIDVANYLVFRKLE